MFSYFVDVTNCDKGAPGYNDSYGYPDYLFLKGVRNPNATGFTAVGRNLTLKYTYDQETTEYVFFRIPYRFLLRIMFLLI